MIIWSKTKHRRAVFIIFLGDELNAVLEAIETDTPYEGMEKTEMKLGVNVLPVTRQIVTGIHHLLLREINFEFRMLGRYIACANIFTRSAVAESLKSMQTGLEKAEDFEEVCMK